MLVAPMSVSASNCLENGRQSRSVFVPWVIFHILDAVFCRRLLFRQVMGSECEVCTKQVYCSCC